MMNLKKIIGVVFLILFTSSLAFVSSWKPMSPQRALNLFSKLVEEEKLDDLTLTIYFIDPQIFTIMPLSVDDLIRGGFGYYKVIVDGSALKEHMDLLKQFNSDKLMPVDQNSRINARYYYVFSRKWHGDFLEVAMMGDNSVFINGEEFQWDPIYYDIIRPFTEMVTQKEPERDTIVVKISSSEA